MGLIVYSIRHYILKYIDMIIINYDYRIYCFDRGKMLVSREHIYGLPKIRYDNDNNIKSHNSSLFQTGPGPEQGQFRGFGQTPTGQDPY